MIKQCEQKCGAVATVYAMGPFAGDWAGYYCQPCAAALKFQITNYLDVSPEEVTHQFPAGGEDEPKEVA